MKKKKRTIDFGKIDFNKTGRKINLVEIEIELSTDNNLSICGNVWNNLKTDIVSGGQNLDELKPYFKYDLLFNKLHRIWKLYHLNDLQAGTPVQMEHIETVRHKHTGGDWYTWACDELDKVGLLTTTYNNKPYKFGSQWLKKDIPQDVLEFLNVEVFNEK